MIPVLLRDEESARRLVAEARGAAEGALRGEAMIEVFRAALRLWRDEPAWRARAAAIVAAGGPGPASDPAQLDGIAELFEPGLWRRRLRAELTFPRALGGLYEGPASDASLAYVPLGVVLHITPGNSFLTAIESLAYALVAGNVNLLRLSQQAPPVAPLLVELLAAAGLPPGQVHLCAWASGSARVERSLGQEVDGVVVWGGADAIRAYREHAGIGVRVIEYGPRLSCSVLSAAALDDTGALLGLAQDASRHEQAACASSQLLFVEVPAGADRAAWRERVLRRVAAALAGQAQKAPPLGRSADGQIEVLRVLERAKLARARGQGDYASGYPDWLAVWKEGAEHVEPSPLGRTWLIYPYGPDGPHGPHGPTHAEPGGALADLQRWLVPVRHHLYTAGLACADAEFPALAAFLLGQGITRVVAPGRATVGIAGAPHDGGFILPGFCKLASIEAPARRPHLWQAAGPDATFTALRHLVRAATRAPFHAERIRAAGIVDGNLTSWEQFHALPWLRKSDFAQHGPPRSGAMLTEPLAEVSGATLFTTGGSTGAPTYTLYSAEEWDEAVDIFARELQLSGLSQGDRVANLFSGGGLWSAFVALDGALRRTDVINLPVGGTLEPGPLLDLLVATGATALVGLPSMLVRLAHAARDRRLTTAVRLVLYGGEHMSEGMSSFVRGAFGAQRVRSIGYSAIDAGHIAYPCAHATGSVHHVLERYAHVELCDEDTGLPVLPGGEGQVVVTCLSRRLLPVLRLRTGDLGRAVTGPPCPCGSTAFRFELLGRSDDMIRIGGANVFLSDVDRLLGRFPGVLGPLFQLQIEKRGADDAYTLCIETSPTLGDEQRSALTTVVTQAYLGLADEVASYRGGGLLRHFEIRLLPPGSLKGNARSGKLRRVLDTRPI